MPDHLDLMGILQKIDHAWFYNISEKDQRPHLMTSFGNVECICLESGFEKYVKSGNKSSLQMVNIGKFTVDLKHMKLFVTFEKYNSDLFRTVLRGHDHYRPRGIYNQRFN